MAGALILSVDDFEFNCEVSEKEIGKVCMQETGPSGVRNMYCWIKKQYSHSKAGNG